MSIVPTKNNNYVKWGHHNLLSQIVGSQNFFPVFITGLSGNGKTMMVEQVCADLKRKLIRINVTIETDEDDLIGGFRLKDGDTVWHYGPVVEAMREGAVLLLDEVDLASNRIMCLQPVLEGNPLYIKKMNEVVTPAPGFTIIATANTKGQGDETGKFIGTNFLNEAFLERFAITLEQKYPSKANEKKILTKIMTRGDEKIVNTLLSWSESIRDTFDDGGSNEVVTTRRLVHILQTNNIIGNINDSVKLCLSRFDKSTQETFYTLWDKMYNLEEIKILDGQTDIEELKKEDTEIELF
jgi:MoxR-like ATPase